VIGRAASVLVALTFSLSAFAAEPPACASIPANETLHYTLKFIDTTAGDCTMESLDVTSWQGKSARHFRATIKTSGLIGLFYPYHETIDLYADPATMNPLFVDINIKDRRKTQHTQIRLDETTLKGEEIEDSTEPGEPPHHRVKGWTMAANGSQSLFSILYFVRTRPLEPGTKVSFPVSHDEKNAEFVGEVVHTEPVATGKGEREGVLVKVSQSFANVFYASIKEEPQLWFSNDARRVPLRFEMKHRLGKVFAILRNP
jgi:hypothetical protein